MKLKKIGFSLVVASFVLSVPCKAQTTAIKTSVYEGIIVTGYVDNGAFINLTGPSIKFTQKPFALMLGLLPSLKIKEDKVANNGKRNTLITPSLGVGLTALYKHFALQLPMFYTGKTAATDGKWNAGIGVGYKF